MSPPGSTPTTAKPGRARRGRVMIVGEIPELARLSPHVQAAPGGPVLASNLFEALGEITVAPASAPITNVLLSEQCLREHDGRAIESLRKIDPSVKLVLIAPAATAVAGDWAAKGIDDCIASPIGPSDLNRLFDADALARQADFNPPESRAGDPPTAPDRPPPTITGITLDELRRKMTSGELPADVVQPLPTLPPQQDAEAHPSQTPPPPQADPPQPLIEVDAISRTTPYNLTEDLGDTDLVESILASSASLTQIALRLIAQQTGWTDIALAPTDDLNPKSKIQIEDPTRRNPKSNSVPVIFNDQSFGFLTTTMAGVDQLAPWADWLARWLALDQSHREFRFKALQDDLTGAWNRRFFEGFLSESIAKAGPARRPVTVMVFDIDNFKPYNDNFGHEAGDDVLRETVRLLKSVIRQGDRVCRIGGDEFAVVFADPEGPRKPAASGGGGGGKLPESIEFIAKRFQDQVCSMRFPKLGKEAPGPLSISAGLATFPWDGNDPASLLRHADQLALESKRKGKNAITFGPGAMRACGPNA